MALPLAIPIAIAIGAAKTAFGAWLWHRAWKDAHGVDARKRIEALLGALDPNLVEFDNEASESATLTAEKYPLPSNPEQLVFPNQSRIARANRDSGQFMIYGWTESGADLIVIAVGFDRHQQFRMIPVMQGEIYQKWRTAVRHRLEAKRASRK